MAQQAKVEPEVPPRRTCPYPASASTLSGSPARLGSPQRRLNPRRVDCERTPRGRKTVPPLLKRIWGSRFSASYNNWSAPGIFPNLWQRALILVAGNLASPSSRLPNSAIFIRHVTTTNLRSRPGRLIPVSARGVLAGGTESVKRNHDVSSILHSSLTFINLLIWTGIIFVAPFLWLLVTIESS